MTRITPADLTPLTPLTALTALTLLSCTRSPAAAPPPFAPLAALPALQRAFLGSCTGPQVPGWAAGGELVGSFSGGRPVTAYLCPAGWEQLSALEVCSVFVWWSGGEGCGFGLGWQGPRVHNPVSGRTKAPDFTASE